MTTTKKILKNALQPTMVKVSELTTVQKARLAVSPSLNGATVIQAYQGNVMGKDVDLSGLIDQLRDTFTEVKGGDLHTLEAMLISQAKPSHGASNHFYQPGTQSAIAGISEKSGSLFGAGLESAGAKPSHHHGAC